MVCEAWLNFHRLVSIRVLGMIRSSATSATRSSGEQILDSVSSLVHQTHPSIVSDDRELCQQVAHIYRRLGERREQVQQFRNTIARTPQSSYDSSTVEIFLDFVSRFSVNGPNSSIDQLLGDIAGHPNYLLETSPSFYPEQYDTASPDRRMSISAILPVRNHSRTQQYFVTFQEKTPGLGHSQPQVSVQRHSRTVANAATKACSRNRELWLCHERLCEFARERKRSNCR